MQNKQLLGGYRGILMNSGEEYYGFWKSLKLSDYFETNF